MFVSRHGSENTNLTVCTYFLTVIVPWTYPDRTRAKLAQNIVSHLTTALSFYQSTIRSLTIVFLIPGGHNNRTQGRGTDLLGRFFHFQQTALKIKKKLRVKKVRIPGTQKPQSLYDYCITIKYSNTAKKLGQKKIYLWFYHTLKKNLWSKSLHPVLCLPATCRKSKWAIFDFIPLKRPSVQIIFKFSN